MSRPLLNLAAVVTVCAFAIGIGLLLAKADYK